MMSNGQIEARNQADCIDSVTNPYEGKSLQRRTASILGLHDVSTPEMSKQSGFSLRHCGNVVYEDRALLALLVNDRLSSFISNEWLISIFTLKELERGLVVDWTRLNPITAPAPKRKANGNGKDSQGEGHHRLPVKPAPTPRPHKAKLNGDGPQTDQPGSDTPPLSDKEVHKRRIEIAASLYSLYDRKMRLYDRIGKGMGVARKPSGSNKGSHTHSPADVKNADSEDYYEGLSEDGLVQDVDEQIKLLTGRVKELRALKKSQESSDANDSL